MGPEVGRAQGVAVAVDQADAGPQGPVGAPAVAVGQPPEPLGVPGPDPDVDRAPLPGPAGPGQLRPGRVGPAQLEGDAAGHQPGVEGGDGPARPAQIVGHPAGRGQGDRVRSPASQPARARA